MMVFSIDDPRITYISKASTISGLARTEIADPGLHGFLSLSEIFLSSRPCATIWNKTYAH